MFPSKDDLFKLMLIKGATGGATVEATAEGNPVVFDTDLARPLKSLILNLSPYQQGSGDPSPTNVRDIVPWTGVNLWQYPENQLVINRNDTQSNNGITFTPIKGTNNKTVAVHVKGQKTSANTFFNLNYVVSQFVPGTYKVYGETANCRYRIFIINAQGQEQSIYTPGNPTFTIPSDAQGWWMRIRVDTENEVDETIYPIVVRENESITETALTLPTLYGGWVDTVSGVLTDKFAKRLLDDSDAWTESDNFFTYSGHDMSDRKTGESYGFYCTAFPAVQKSTGTAYIRWGGTTAFNLLIAKNGSSLTLAELKELSASGDLAICYELATPQEIQLTPAQTSALRGSNTLWSDGNGNLNVTYLKKG